MQQRVRLRSLAWLRIMGSALLILAVLAAGLAAPANAQAQDVGDPTIDPTAEVVGPPGPVEPVLPVEPAAWEGEVDILEYVEPLAPMDVADTAAVWAGKTTRISLSDDTFIASGQPGTNFSNLSTMGLGWPNDGYQASRILLKVNVGPLPDKAKIYNAKLYMYLDSASPATPPTTMHLNGALIRNGWRESEVNWNNASGIGGGQWRLGDVGTSPGWKGFNLTSQVQQWVNGQGNNGLMIIGYEVSPNGRIFRSRHYGGSEPYVEVSYECDTLPPVTKVNGLPSTSPGSFTVTWGGYDQAPKGCTPTGIRKFAVQYRINGGAWVDWKSTTSTSATFDNYAPNGSTVDFRVYADDNAGNVEAKPKNPQATTRIVSQAPVVTMTPLPAVTNASSFTIQWNATSALIGVASYDVQWQINNGGWADLLAGTTQTSYAVANAQSEYTYAFRVRARDRVGNVSAYPAVPQASTTVVLYPIATMTTFNPNIINANSPVTTSFTLRWTGNTPPGTVITQYQIHYRVRDFSGAIVQNWSVWQTFDGSLTNVTFPIQLSNGLYDFEATATNDKGQTTPFAGKAEATMIVDQNNSIQPRAYMPQVAHR